MKLLVRKSRYQQKKQDIHQLKNQNQQLQDQISQLQALQKENPTQARTQTIKNLSKKLRQYLQSFKWFRSRGWHRERERESNFTNIA